MNCPRCGTTLRPVVSRTDSEPLRIVRRRQCRVCRARWTTIETIAPGTVPRTAEEEKARHGGRSHLKQRGRPDKPPSRSEESPLAIARQLPELPRIK